MTAPNDISEDIARVSGLLRAKLGVRGATLGRQVEKARHRLPRHVQAQARRIAEAEAVVDNPRLKMTVDVKAVKQAANDVAAHLSAIDVADRRKGWILGMLGGLSFNLIAMVALLFAVLIWRGFL